MRYRVTATMIVVKLTGSGNDRERYLDRGQLLPPGADPQHVEMLLALGLVERVPETPQAEESKVPAETPPAPAKVAAKTAAAAKK